MTSASIISTAPLSELIRKIETGLIADRDISPANALAFVRDGVITGEGPTDCRSCPFSPVRWMRLTPHGARAF